MGSFLAPSAQPGGVALPLEVPGLGGSEQRCFNRWDLQKDIKGPID